MKYVLWCVIILLGISFFLLTKRTDKQTRTHSMDSTPTPQISKTPPKTISANDETYAYDIIVADPINITLIPNYSERKSARSVVEQKACDGAANGGFYDTDNKPLGYVRVENDTISNPIPSALLNGYVSIDTTATIGSTVPPDSSRIILQTGPLLFEKGQCCHFRSKMINTPEEWPQP